MANKYNTIQYKGDHKLRHNFQGCVSPMCSFSQDIETTTHFLLHCPNHHCARKTLFHKINHLKTERFKNYKEFAIR